MLQCAGASHYIYGFFTLVTWYMSYDRRGMYTYAYEIIHFDWVVICQPRGAGT